MHKKKHPKYSNAFFHNYAYHVFVYFVHNDRFCGLTFVFPFVPSLYDIQFYRFSYGTYTAADIQLPADIGNMRLYRSAADK